MAQGDREDEGQDEGGWYGLVGSVFENKGQVEDGWNMAEKEEVDLVHVFPSFALWIWCFWLWDDWDGST